VYVKYLPVENAALPLYLAVGVRAPHERSGRSNSELKTFGGSIAGVYELWKVLLLHLNCSRVEEKCRGKERKRMSADCLGVVRLNEHEASEQSSSQYPPPQAVCSSVLGSSSWAIGLLAR
jgi:hypothetical protein